MRTQATHQSLSQAVVEAVADAEDVDPLDLGAPLYDVIDPDALDALFGTTHEGGRRTGRVTFEYCGHTVVVASDGAVTIADDSTVSEEAI